MNRILALVLVGTGISAMPATLAQAKGADVHAALVRCADVSVPGPLSGCGSDPLASGEVELKRSGDVEVELVGGLPGATYDVVLRSVNGSAAMPLGTLTTNGSGRGEMQRRNLFDLDQAGLITVALLRDGSVQFVAGFAGEAQLKATLLMCGDVNVPAALSSCGGDTLKGGSVKIEDGDAVIDLTGPPSTSYDVVFLGLDGSSETPLGPLTTDKKGKGLLLRRGAFDEAAVGAGNIVLRGNSSVQFVSGFQSTRRRPAEVARFQVGLVRCGAVNQLAPLAGCGADTFTKGLVTIDEGGHVKVEVVAAVPAVQYEAVFVSFDASAELSIGTFQTNPAGNGQVHVRDFFPAGVHGAGNVVIRRDGVDQFVTGFAVVR